MRVLPDCFKALAAFNQFVLWQAVPSSKKVGKFDKITINPQTLMPHSAHDPSIHFSAADALAMVQPLPESFGVGFAFTEKDPFWFFDLDGCVTPDGEWNKESSDWCRYFTGAAVEVSHSGKGLHIIGSGAAVVPSHSKKNIPLGLEFYTSARFVALTGQGTSGDSGFDASLLLLPFVDKYFPPKHTLTDAKWTTEPDPMARPLKTDKALIKRMLDSTSAAHVWGGKVSARDLWECNVEKLDAAYGTLNTTDSFDRSSADQALCNHLAFWTGKDCERMERLFNMSALVRDKWTDRKQYRQDTILNACSGCRDVYGSQKAAKEDAQIEWKPEQLVNDNIQVEATGGARIVAYQERAAYFFGHYFLTKQSKVFCPDGEIRNQSDYNAMYSTVEFAEAFGGKPIKEAWKAYVTAPDVTRAQVFNTAYRPEYQFGTIFNEDSRDWVNEYVNMDGARVEGDAGPFIDHVKIMLPNGRDAEILLSWMAALIQYPGKKFLWSPFLQGCEGNGKSLITRVLGYCIGSEHVEDIDPEDFCNSGGKFNSYIKNHRLGVLEELKTGSRNQAEAALKRFIGNERIQVQSKGVDQLTIKTCINFLVNSNHKDAIRVDDNTRRFAILYTAQQERGDLLKHDMQRGGQYFTRLFDWMWNDSGWGKIANMLATYAIPAELNPAGNADKAPETSSFLDAIVESKTVPHQAVVEILGSGRPGTLGGWVSITALRQIIQKDYGIRAPSGKMLAVYLKSEGYIRHPALKNNGRTTKSIIQEGGQRSVLYCKEGTIQHHNLHHAQDVTDQYMRDQGYIGMPMVQNERLPTTV